MCVGVCECVCMWLRALVCSFWREFACVFVYVCSFVCECVLACVCVSVYVCVRMRV